MPGVMNPRGNAFRMGRSLTPAFAFSREDLSDLYVTSPAMQALQDEFARLMMDEIQLTEARCALFLATTGLPIEEVVLVKFRGKTFPQWRGAVASLRAAPRWED